MDAIQPISGDDLILWPCGTLCERRDLREYAWKSDDFEVIAVDSARWNSLVDESAGAAR